MTDEINTKYERELLEYKEANEDVLKEKFLQTLSPDDYPSKDDLETVFEKNKVSFDDFCRKDFEEFNNL